MTNYRKTMAEALIEVFAEELSPDEIAKEQSKAIDQFNDDMAKEFPKEKFTARANVSPLGGGIAFEFGVIPAKDAKGVDLLNAPAHSKFMMHLTDNKNRAVPMSKFSVEHIMGRLPVKFRKVTGKSPTDAVKKVVDWFKKNKRDFEGLVKEEVELGEGPMDGFLRLTFKSPADVKKAMKVSDTEFGYRHFSMDKARTRPELDIEGDRDDLQRLKGALKSAGIKFKIDLEEEVQLDEKKETAQYTDGGSEKITVTVDNMRKVNIDNVITKNLRPGWKKVEKKSGGVGRSIYDEVEIDEGSKEEYQKFFNAAMKKFKIDSPADLKSDEEKKKFFDYVDKNYKGEKEEELRALKSELKLHEGTWHIPDSSKEKAGLKKLMKKPVIFGKDGDNATDAIAPYIGDDELYNDLYADGKADPKGDARFLIKKAMKRLGIKEEVELDENFGVHKDIPAMEVGTDRYRDYVVGLTPGEGNPEWAKARDFKVQSMRESLIKIWEKAEKQDEDEDEKIAPVKGKKTMTGGAVAKVETKPKIDG